MSYTKREFQPNTTLYASELNLMDDQIALNESNINTLDNTIVKMDKTIGDLELKTEHFNGTDEDSLYITDANNNVIAMIDKFGITSVDFILPQNKKISSAIQDIEELQNTTNTIEITMAKLQSRLIITMSGLTPDRTYSLEVMRRANRKNNVNKWTRVGQYGYALLAGHPYKEVDSGIIYQDVPSWMPNNGLVQSSFIFTAIENYHIIEIDLSVWCLDMIKPIDGGTFPALVETGVSSPVSLMGVAECRPHVMLPFTVHLYNEDHTVCLAKCPTTFYLNAKYFPSTSDKKGYSSDMGIINPRSSSGYRLQNLRISLKD